MPRSERSAFFRSALALASTFGLPQLVACGGNSSGPGGGYPTSDVHYGSDVDTASGLDVTPSDTTAADTTIIDTAIDTSRDTLVDSEPLDTASPFDTTPANDTAPGDASSPGGFFAQPMSWDQPVAGLDPDGRSGALIRALADRGGWGNDNIFQIDFSIVVLDADATTPFDPFTPNDDFYDGDCDAVAMPVPAGGALEGEPGYACNHDGDCHLIVRTGDALYEMWRADIEGGDFSGGCLAVWDHDRAWPDSLRGEGCTSADAAGLPIAPLLFTADEVKAGAIEHAIRFILPNDRIAHRQYVRPSTHATGAASATDDGMPYGVRLRLRDDYPVDTLPSVGARVVARALQKYGMILADGGEIALTAQSDRNTAATWDTLIEPQDLQALQVTDFAVVDMGDIHDWDGDCRRN